MTICHVNVSRWDNPPSQGRVHSKKRNMYVLKLCTFPGGLMAEITRNRNGHTRNVKCSHFRISSVVNRPYLDSQTITYYVLSHRILANQTPRNLTRDAFMNKYVCVPELIVRLFRDVSLGRLCSDLTFLGSPTSMKTGP